MSNQAEAEREAADTTASATASAPVEATATSGAVTAGAEPAPVQSLDDEYVFRTVIDDDLGGMSLEDAIAGTIVEFDDGDIVKGTVVKVDKDEVLLDIGFKSEEIG